MKALSQCFFQKMVENSFPTVKAYIDDILPAVCSNQRTSKYTRNQLGESTSATNMHNTTQASNAVVQHKKSGGLENKGNSREDVFADFFEKSFMQLPVPCINDENLLATTDRVSDITNKLATRFQIFDEGPSSMPQTSMSIEELICPRSLSITSYLDANQIENYNHIRMSKFTKEIYLFKKESSPSQVAANELLKQKFSWSTLRFYNLSGNDEVGVNLDRNKVLPPDKILSETPSNLKEEKFCKGDNWGLSLNERVLGRKRNDHNTDKFGPEPSFNLFDDAVLDQNISPQSGGLILSVDKVKTSSKPDGFSSKVLVSNNTSPVRKISFLLPKGAPQKSISTPDAYKMCQQSPLPSESSTKFGQSTLSGSDSDGFRIVGQNTYLASSQVVFSNAFENEVYNLIKSFAGKMESRRVMDYFTELFLCDQHTRIQTGEFLHNEVIKYVVDSQFSDLLMNPHLNHVEHKDCFREINIGFRLEKAGLVHIPCIVPTQHSQAVWFLVVANFIDKSFDVLNPSNNPDAITPLISAICYNFKIFFIESFPHCPYFNIRDFNIRHIEVPKTRVRVDSGIYVLRFMISYNGIGIENFPKLASNRYARSI